MVAHMDKNKLAFAAGGASTVAAALAMNVGTAAAECEQVVACDGGGGSDVFFPLQKINSVISKLEAFDKASPFDKLHPAISKLELVLGKFILRFD